MSDNTKGKKENGFLNNFFYPLLVVLLGGGIFTYHQFFDCPETKDVIGYVKERQEDKEIVVAKANIEITSDKIGRRTTTDVNGKFVFENISSFDSIQIRVTHKSASKEYTRVVDFCSKKPHIELEAFVLEPTEKNSERQKKVEQSNSSAEREVQSSEFPPYHPSACKGAAFSEFKINDLKGDLFCCQRKGNNVACYLGVSRKIEGVFQVCAYDSGWNSYLFDDLGNRYPANEIQWNGKTQKRCLEVNYLKGMGDIKMEVNFGQVSQHARKVAKLEISTTIGVLVYRNIPIQ